MTPPPMPHPSDRRPILLVVRTAQLYGDDALDQLAHRLRHAALGLEAATGADVRSHLPTGKHLRAYWHAAPPDGAGRTRHRRCEVDLREQARLVIALLAGPARDLTPRDLSVNTLAPPLKRYRPALLWTDDLSRLSRSAAGHAQLLHALQRTDTVAGDNHTGLIHVDDPIAHPVSWLLGHPPAQGPAKPTEQGAADRR